MIKAFLLSATIIASIYVVPEWGHDYINKIDVSAQKETETTIGTDINNDTHIIANNEMRRIFLDILRNQQEAKNERIKSIKGETEEQTNKIIEDNVHEEPKNYISGYCITNVNVRTEPNMESEILEVYPIYTEIQYINLKEEWVEIKYGDGLAYIYSDYINTGKPQYKEYSVPHNIGFKSYMSYEAITSKSSPQYKLQSNYAYTGTYGIRQIDGRFCVALGTAFNASVGTYIDLVLQNGTVIPCVLSDIKANNHTQSNNIVTSHNGCVSEFLVSTKVLNSNAKRDGDISSCQENWKSPVVVVKVYNENAFD